MNYGNLIGEAFRIAWRNRFLWFFGLFISGGIASFNVNVPPNPDISIENSTTEGVPVWLFNLGQWAQENIVLAVTLGIVILVLILVVFYVLWMISSAGLSDSVAAMERGERRGFGSTWRAGVRNLLRMFLLLVLFFLISLVLGTLIVGPATLGIFGIVAATESVGLRVLFISLIALVAFVIYLVVFIALYLVSQLTIRELVIGRQGVIASVGSGYRLFRYNLGRVLVVWIIQFGIAAAVGVAVFIVVSIVTLVQTFGFIALSYAAPYPLVVGLAVGVGLLLSLPVIIFYAILGVFNHAYWTLAYLQLTAGGTPQGEYTPGSEG